MGFMAASPFLVKGVCSPLSGLAADMLRKSTVSTKNVRRVFYAAGTKKKRTYKSIFSILLSWLKVSLLTCLW